MKNKQGLAFVFAILGMIVAIHSCVTPPEYPNQPEITFISIDKDTVRQSLDSNFITIGFTDGDGNLGAGDADTSFNLFLTDTRLNATIPYRIPFIPDQGVGNGISGEVRITLLPTDNCCINVDIPCLNQVGAPNESVIYELQIVDRSGNFSNVLQIPIISLRCDY